MTKLRSIQKKYGKTPALYIEHIHRLYTSGREAITTSKLTGVDSGTYVYPYAYFREEQGFTDTHTSMILKRLRDAELLTYVKIGGTPFYKVNYKNQEIIDAGLFEPEI